MYPAFVFPGSILPSRMTGDFPSGYTPILRRETGCWRFVPNHHFTGSACSVICVPGPYFWRRRRSA